MFTPDRIFATQSQKAGKPEWYFQAREGNSGPYETRKQAEFMLKKFVETCIELGYSGGRKQESKNSPAAVKIQSFLHYELKGDLQWV